MNKNTFYIIIGLFLFSGCANNTVQTEVEPDTPELIVGEINQALVDILSPEPIEYSLDLIDENEVYQFLSASVDIKEDGFEDIFFNVWLFKEDNRQLFTLKSQANSNVGFVIDETVENRFELLEGGDFRVPLLAEKGDIIKANKVLSQDSEGNVIHSDSLIWTQNENLFAAEIIRNQSYTPSGLKTFNPESNFLPIRLDGKIGWIDFDLVFQEATMISSIKVNRIVLSKN